MMLTDVEKSLIKKSILGVVEQGAIAYSPFENQCLLRTPDGMSCAVGQLVNDDCYYPDLEAEASPKAYRSIRLAIAASHPELKLDVTSGTLPLWDALSRLQDLHDNSQTPSEFQSKAYEAFLQEPEDE